MTRWVFLGSDPIALPALEALVRRADAVLVGVYTQPDRASGRGQQVRPNAIKQWALARGLPVWQPERLGAEDEARLRELGVGLALVMAYGQILRQSFLDALPRGVFNLHTSLLPLRRGASPIQSAVAAGERETGVTLMRVVLALDAGPVVGAERVEIGRLDTALEVDARLGRAAAPLMERHWSDLLAGTAAATPQDEARATYCRRLDKGDSALDFRRPAEELAARVHGMFPWPGCQVEIAGARVKLGLAEAMEASPAGAPPGAVLAASSAGLEVACGRGVLRILKLQRPGGRMLPAGEFLRGFPVEPGVVLPSAEMPPLESARPFPRRSALPG